VEEAGKEGVGLVIIKRGLRGPGPVILPQSEGIVVAQVYARI
jgi:hypothetical protein